MMFPKMVAVLFSGVAMADRSVTDGNVNLEVMGQSGRFKIQTVGTNRSVTVLMDEIREVDAGGNAIGNIGPQNGKHTLMSFATQAFTINNPIDQPVNGLNASKVRFETDINSVGHLVVDTFIMRNAGDVGPSGAWSTIPGDLKWCVSLTSWSFLSNGVAVELDIKVTGNSGTATPQGSRNTGNSTWSLGDGVALQLTDIVEVDGVNMSMGTGYPKMVMKGNAQVFTFRFPKFTTNATYDPLISGMEQTQLIGLSAGSSWSMALWLAAAGAMWASTSS